MNPRRVGVPFSILAALACNKWALERLFAADEEFSGTAVTAAIVVLQMAFAGTGVLLRRNAIPRRLASVVSTFAVIAAIAGLYGTWVAITTEKQAEERAVLAMVERAEALYLDQAQRLKSTLDQSAQNLLVPDHQSTALFSEFVIFRDVEKEGPLSQRGVIGSRVWELAAHTDTLPRDTLAIWTPLWDSLDYLEWSKFFIHLGAFRDDTERDWDVQMRFNGGAVDRSGRRVGIRGEAAVTFSRVGDNWRISRWITRSLETHHTPHLLFAEVLDDIVPAPRTRHRARHTQHDSLTLAALTDSLFEKPHPFFTIQSFDRAPALAVVDVNRDGRDDLYIMGRWGPNQLLVDRGNGTFEDRAAEYGLDFRDHSSCAIFADFDNDEDPDLFLGRSLDSSLYLENVGGRFVDRSATHIDGNLPHLAASIASADYDNDGLLDVYISTYFAHAISQHTGSTGNALEALRPHLSVSSLREIQRRVDEGVHHIFLNRTGPANVLLHNDGNGRFSVAEAPELDIWLNTYQSTWGDHDGDGDADLYVANDFGLNNLIENLGDGRFRDITDRSGTADIGFGMGASWGDYDGDGDADLYVANMFSKAGQRITSMIPNLDPAITAMARGNSLFRNDGVRFEKTSGPEEPSLQVEWGGWSWGGQFCDLDRDGCLDIHTLAGYYTAPPAIEVPVDT